MANGIQPTLDNKIKVSELGDTEMSILCDQNGIILEINDRKREEKMVQYFKSCFSTGPDFIPSTFIVSYNYL